jgi:hypothetical protein
MELNSKPLGVSGNIQFFFNCINDELLSLGNDCGANFSSYEYCKDYRFVGYLSQYNILNTDRP